jgi:hypothetical protein
MALGTPATATDAPAAPEGQEPVVLGVLAARGIARDLAEQLADERP